MLKDLETLLRAAKAAGADRVQVDTNGRLLAIAPSDFVLDIITGVRVQDPPGSPVPIGDAISAVTFAVYTGQALTVSPAPLRYPDGGTSEWADIPGVYPLPLPDFPGAARQVLPAVSTDPTRPYFHGAFLSATGEVVASNGHRLHLATVALSRGLRDRLTAVDRGGVLIGTPALKFLAKVFDRRGPSTGLHFDPIRPGRPRFIAVTSAGLAWSLTARAADGTYPDYHRAIPHDAGAPVLTATAKDLAAFCRVALLRASKPYFTVAFKLGKAFVADQEVPAGGVRIGWGREAPIRYNLKYLRDFAAAYPGHTLSLAAVSPRDPARVTADGKLAGVLMPVRVQ